MIVDMDGFILYPGPRPQSSCPLKLWISLCTEKYYSRQKGFEIKNTGALIGVLS